VLTALPGSSSWIREEKQRWREGEKRIGKIKIMGKTGKKRGGRDVRRENLEKTRERGAQRTKARKGRQCCTSQDQLHVTRPRPRPRPAPSRPRRRPRPGVPSPD